MNKCLNCEQEAKVKYCSISCQNKHQGSIKADIRWGIYKLFDVECNKCKNYFKIKEREKLFPQKKTYYCSRACANTRVHSDETKLKIRLSLNNNTTIGSRNIDQDKTCKECKRM